MSIYGVNDLKLATVFNGISKKLDHIKQKYTTFRLHTVQLIKLPSYIEADEASFKISSKTLFLFFLNKYL